MKSEREREREREISCMYVCVREIERTTKERERLFEKNFCYKKTWVDSDAKKKHFWANIKGKNYCRDKDLQNLYYL